MNNFVKLTILFYITIVIILSGCAGGNKKGATVTVTTFVGVAGDAGDVSDQTGTAARLNRPTAITTDDDNNLYVTDSQNNKIKKVTIQGYVTEYANPPFSGESYPLLTPYGICFDRTTENLYIADTFNHIIRKYVSATSVPIIAGTFNTFGSSDSPALFHHPYGITMDQSGFLYVADSSNHIIRKLNPTTGAVTTIAGSAGNSGYDDGIGNNARFNSPDSLTIDSLGNLFVSDYGNHTIRKINPTTGAVTTFAGYHGLYGSSDDIGAEARFDHPWGLAIDNNDNIYVADSENHTIRKITPAGRVTTIAGYARHYGSTDGEGTVARFWNPRGIAIDNNGNIYVAELFNHTIRKIVIR